MAGLHTFPRLSIETIPEPNFFHYADKGRPLADSFWLIDIPFSASTALTLGNLVAGTCTWTEVRNKDLTTFSKEGEADYAGASLFFILQPKGFTVQSPEELTTRITQSVNRALSDLYSPLRLAGHLQK